MFKYSFSNSADLANYTIRGGAPRSVLIDGREGINLRGINDRLVIPEHTANCDKGSLELWIASLEDLHPLVSHPGHSMSNRFFENFNFISDCEAINDFNSGGFVLGYCTNWHPVLIGKFFRGNVSEGYYRLDGPHALSTANYFFLRRQQWYQIVFTWDKVKGLYRIYANGILVGVEDFNGAIPKCQDIGSLLYIGNPMICYSELAFHDDCLESESIQLSYQQNGGRADSEINRELKEIYQDAPSDQFSRPASSGWEEAMSLSLTSAKDLERFILQGRSESVSITDRGLRINTPPHDPMHYKINADATSETHKHLDNDFRQVYAWTEEVFEGDIHISYDFQILSRGGLGLLISQASGMQGEDFLADYPPRTSGSMQAVCWEDIRNYHWEFYREMKDTRHDNISHAMLKNPWFKPLGFKIVPGQWELNRWYRLDFLQAKDEITCAIDNLVVMRAKDNAFDNNGPIFRQGHVAIRCMLNTDMLIRNLTVSVSPDVVIK